MSCVPALTEPNSDKPGAEAPGPGDAEVHAALGRIAGSSRFRASLRLTAFLRYVVERTLAGRGAEIKGYTIAVEALGRDQSFEPEADPIVRVEAGRLRQALALYYGGAGIADPVIIALPRGSYVPQFRRATAGDGGSERGELQALFSRLAMLHRELEAVTADIERMWKNVGPGKVPPPATD
jgi:hypothetical protein